MTASTYTAMILAACHSLVVVEDEGDGAEGKGFNVVGERNYFIKTL